VSPDSLADAPSSATRSRVESQNTKREPKARTVAAKKAAPGTYGPDPGALKREKRCVMSGGPMIALKAKRLATAP
jgi:hypothetical protein